MKKLLTSIVLFVACVMMYAQSFNIYHLINNKGMTMSVTDYGARIVTLCVPGADGVAEDIVCGFDSLESYAKYKQNFGATVGRYIGRILGAKFTLDGTTYSLDAESNGHCSHGGKPGFANRIWKVIDQTANRLTLRYVSPDGESGFPGCLTMNVTMTLTDDNALQIDYEATTDKPTVLNPSNHSFFNISADFTRSVLDQVLMIDGDSIALYDDAKCVTGKMMAVEGTPFDFRKAKRIGTDIDDDDAQLRVTNGYDHTYRLNHAGDFSVPAARIYDEKSGRTMEVYTTEPALHIYTANGLKGNQTGKGGIAYAKRTAICFETMHFADSPNKPHWPSTVLRPGERFRSSTKYKFGE